MRVSNIKTCVLYKQSVCDTKIKIDFYGATGDDIKLMPWQDLHYIRDSLNKEQYDKLQKQIQNIKSDKKLTVYVVRHAETFENANGDKFIGITEAQLNDIGKEQSQKVDVFFQHKKKLMLFIRVPK